MKNRNYRNDRNGSGGLKGFLSILALSFLFYGIADLVGSRFEAKNRETHETEHIFEIMKEKPEGNTEPGIEETAAPKPTESPEPIPSHQDPIDVPTDRYWNAVMTLPTYEEIEEFDRTRTYESERSPYIAGYMSTDMCERFVAYSVELKADYMPAGTYWSTANVALDYPTLRSTYRDVHSDYWMSFYNGLQAGDNGYTNAIFTIWDQFMTDYAGNESVLHAQLIYPAGDSARPNQDLVEGHFVNYLPAYLANVFIFCVDKGFIFGKTSQ